MSEGAGEEPRGPRPARDFPVEAGEDGSRLETFLTKALGYSRETALKALRKGWVRLDGKRARGGQRVARGQVVRIANYGLLPPPALSRPTAAPPVNQATASWEREARASIRYEEPAWLVSAKPAGIPTHRGTGQAVGWIEAVGAARGEPLTPVGRLDRDTSGLLALARGRAGARALFAALEAGTLFRVYWALVWGRAPASGRIEQALTKQGPQGAEQMRADLAGAPAATRYRLLGAGRRASLLEVELETGRTHQIRAHLAGAGHPLLGDPRYGTPAAQSYARELGLERLFLHAGRLVVPRFDGGSAHEFREPLPPELRRALERAGVPEPRA